MWGKFHSPSDALWKIPEIQSLFRWPSTPSGTDHESSSDNINVSLSTQSPQANYVKYYFNPARTPTPYTYCIFFSPPKKFDSTGYYYAFTILTNFDNIYQPQMGTMYIMKIDPHNLWSIKKLPFYNMQSNIKSQRVIKATTHIINESNTMVLLSSKNEHYQINQLNNNDYIIHTECDEDIIKEYLKMTQPLYFIDIPHELQLFKHQVQQTDSNNLIQCNKVIWQFVYNKQTYILKKIDMDLYHNRSDVLSALATKYELNKHRYTRIEDKLKQKFYQVYYNQRVGSTSINWRIKSILIFKLKETNYKEFKQFNMLCTKIDIIIYNGVLMILDHKCEHIFIYNLHTSERVARWKTNIYRPRKCTFLSMDKKIFNSHYISFFAQVPSTRSQLSIDLCNLIDIYIGNQHWKHELIIFPRMIFTDDNDTKYDQNPVIVDLYKIMAALEFLCLVD